MNITTAQLHSIRRLVSKEDRKTIAEHAQMSERTVEAVLNGTRTNDEIERAVVRMVRQRVAHMARLCGNKWDVVELWDVLKKNYKDVFLHGVYCCDLLCRLIGVTDKDSVNYYNEHIL